MATDAQTLLEEAKCYQCNALDGYSLQLIRIGLWREILLAQNPSADVSPEGLLAASKCYACYGADPFMLRLFKLGLMIQIAGGTVYEIEAVRFFAAAGITDPAQQAAINALIVSAKENGWWDLCDFIYPFVGGNANAHSFNLKDTSRFQISWNGGVTHGTNGITGNGTTGYGTTGFIPSGSSLVSLNSGHLSTYMRTAGSATKTRLGVFDGTNRFSLSKTNIPSGRSNGAINATAEAVLIVNEANQNFGLTMCIKLDALNVHGYTTAVDLARASASNGIPTKEAYILALNNNGSASAFDDTNLAFASGGSSMSYAMFQLMATDVQTFQTALGRQV